MNRRRDKKKHSKHHDYPRLSRISLSENKFESYTYIYIYVCMYFQQLVNNYPRKYIKYIYY